MKIRAGAFNHEMTEALGVNIKRIHAVVFALGVGLASIAGMLATARSVGGRDRGIGHRSGRE